jgi:dTDP-4-amino-4,6-dideoxygalactose transaminase
MIYFSNPAAQFQSYQSEIEEAVLDVMRGKQYILGDQVASLEEEFAKYIGADCAVGVANGTDSIELALRALEIGPGDEVITVSHTAVATVAAIESIGATAVLVDIEPQFYTLNTEQLQEVFSKKTKAVIAVHLYGQAADLDSILFFCHSNSIYLIEDVSQAHGAKYKDKRLGSIGDIGCFSCYPTKNLGAIGDAGLVTTNDSNLAKKIKMLREYGWNNRVSEYAGRNSRLDELQASILRVKLRHLDLDNSKRRNLAEYYDSNLIDLPYILPEIRENVEPVFHLYVVQVEDRESLMKFLLKEGIQLGIHYPLPVHLQPAYKNLIKTSNNMDVTEDITQRIVSLPMYPELSKDDASKVVNALKKFLN